MRSQRKGRGFESRCLQSAPEYLKMQKIQNSVLHFHSESAIIHTVRKHSSAGMSVRLTRERSWVRAPLLPLMKTSYFRREYEVFLISFFFLRRPGSRPGGRPPIPLRSFRRYPAGSTDCSGVLSWPCICLCRDTPADGRNRFPLPAESASRGPSPPFSAP